MAIPGDINKDKKLTIETDKLTLNLGASVIQEARSSHRSRMTSPHRRTIGNMSSLRKEGSEKNNASFLGEDAEKFRLMTNAI